MKYVTPKGTVVHCDLPALPAAALLGLDAAVGDLCPEWYLEIRESEDLRAYDFKATGGPFGGLVTLYLDKALAADVVGVNEGGSK